MLDDAQARRVAAGILRPLYEADGLNEKLLRVLEIEAEHADSVSEKLATIAQAVRVAEGPLGRSDRERCRTRLAVFGKPLRIPSCRGGSSGSSGWPPLRAGTRTS